LREGYEQRQAILSNMCIRLNNVGNTNHINITNCEVMMKPIDILTNGQHSETIAKNKCTGCGQPAVEFKDELSKREYKISGFCQKCQDDVFGGG